MRTFESRQSEDNFADRSVTHMSELPPRHTVLTVDEFDFRVYRRKQERADLPSLFTTVPAKIPLSALGSTV